MVLGQLREKQVVLPLLVLNDGDLLYDHTHIRKEPDRTATMRYSIRTEMIFTVTMTTVRLYRSKLVLKMSMGRRKRLIMESIES